jgi:hypothetical protein
MPVEIDGHDPEELTRQSDASRERRRRQLGPRQRAVRGKAPPERLIDAVGGIVRCRSAEALIGGERGNSTVGDGRYRTAGRIEHFEPRLVAGRHESPAMRIDDMHERAARQPRDAVEASGIAHSLGRAVGDIKRGQKRQQFSKQAGDGNRIDDQPTGVMKRDGHGIGEVERITGIEPGRNLGGIGHRDAPGDQGNRDGMRRRRGAEPTLDKFPKPAPGLWMLAQNCDRGGQWLAIHAAVQGRLLDIFPDRSKRRLETGQLQGELRRIVRACRRCGSRPDRRQIRHRQAECIQPMTLQVIRRAGRRENGLRRQVDHVTALLG